MKKEIFLFTVVVSYILINFNCAIYKPFDKLDDLYVESVANLSQFDIDTSEGYNKMNLKWKEHSHIKFEKIIVKNGVKEETFNNPKSPLKIKFLLDDNNYVKVIFYVKPNKNFDKVLVGEKIFFLKIDSNH